MVMNGFGEFNVSPNVTQTDTNMVYHPLVLAAFWTLDTQNTDKKYETTTFYITGTKSKQ